MQAAAANTLNVMSNITRKDTSGLNRADTLKHLIQDMPVRIPNANS